MNLLEVAVRKPPADRLNIGQNMRAGCTYTLDDMRNGVKFGECLRLAESKSTHLGPEKSPDANLKVLRSVGRLGVVVPWLPARAQPLQG